MTKHQEQILAALYLADKGTAIVLKRKHKAVAATMLGAGLVDRRRLEDGRSAWFITEKGAAIVESKAAQDEGRVQ